MNLLSELGRKTRQIQDIRRKTHFVEHGLGEFHEPPRLRHLARTSVLAARGAVDEQNAWIFVQVIVPPLRCQHRLARGEPIHRDFVIRVGKSGAGLARDRRLARMAVGVPGRSNDCINLALQRAKHRVDETAAITTLEFLTRQFDGRHALADVRVTHALSYPRAGRPAA